MSEAIDNMTSTLHIPEPEEQLSHPLEGYLRTERLPHIWCSTCGIGTVITAFITGLQKSGLNRDDVAVVSGIGCSGRAAGYLRLDSFHSTHGRAIPYATGLALGNPKLKVVIISGDGDIAAIGGNHFIHAARRNIDLTVICINNFNYAMTGGQACAPTTGGGLACTPPHGVFGKPSQTAILGVVFGAVFVSRGAAQPSPVKAKSLSETLG